MCEEKKREDVRLECLQWTPEQKARWDWKKISTLYSQNRGKKETRKKVQKKLKSMDKEEVAYRNTVIVKLLSLVYFGIFTIYGLVWDGMKSYINLKTLSKMSHLWTTQGFPFFIYFSINIFLFYY